MHLYYMIYFYGYDRMRLWDYVYDTMYIFDTISCSQIFMLYIMIYTYNSIDGYAHYNDVIHAMDVACFYNVYVFMTYMICLCDMYDMFMNVICHGINILKCM